MEEGMTAHREKRASVNGATDVRRSHCAKSANIEQRRGARNSPWRPAKVTWELTSLHGQNKEKLCYFDSCFSSTRVN